MRCEIIKDLLPLYCDDVLSEVSKEEVKKHLTECDDCKNAYEEMKKGDIKIDKAQKDIEPMKKVKNVETAATLNEIHKGDQSIISPP